MRIIVVRHASTSYNANHLINGQHDDPLSSQGLKELPELVNKLKAYDFTLIYSSPLKRALKTAEAISGARDLAINIDPRLKEVNFGSFTSQNWDSMKEIFGLDSRALLDTYDYDLTEYGGESSSQVKKRVQNFLNDLPKKSDQNLLIVTHGGIIRWLYLLCANQKTSVHPNSSIHIFNLNAKAL